MRDVERNSESPDGDGDVMFIPPHTDNMNTNIYLNRLSVLNFLLNAYTSNAFTNNNNEFVGKTKSRLRKNNQPNQLESNR